MSSLSRRHGFVFTFVVTVVLAAPLVEGEAQAQAQGANQAARAEARRLLREGNKAFEQGNYPGALERFEKALQIFPSARIQYNIGQSLRELRRPAEATEAFETFLRDADRITSQERKEAAAALKELEPSVARFTVTTNVPEVQVTVGGRIRGKTPLPAPLVLAPGIHDVTLARAGFKSVRDTIKVAAGEQRRASFQLVENDPVVAVAPPPMSPAPVSPAPRPPAPVATAPATGPSYVQAPPLETRAAPPGPMSSAATGEGWRSQTIVGVSLLGASAAFASVAGILMASSWSRFNDAERNCHLDCEESADEVDSRVLWSKLLFGAAALTGAGGIGAFLLPPDRPGDVSGSGLMLVKQGTF